MDIASMIDDTGKFLAYAWPGGYPIIYVMDDGELLCHRCMNHPTTPVHTTGLADGWLCIGADVYYEGPTETCAHCHAPIESAYGDPYADESAS